MPSPENKRVAKNAVALTLRMVLATLVGLYTSRIVLGALGVVDYGIYGVVGGVVGMASFLNAAMAGATSRFITFEMGRGNQQKLKSIFSTALCIHIGIAIVVFVLAETVGLWFVNNKMNFPAERMFAVNVLYQFTILSMFVNFTQVPYAADIIAHEKMNIYAYFEIINVVLKLVIVYFLLIVSGDRLIYYSFLTFVLSILNVLFYRWFCIRNFREARLSLAYDKRIAKEMLTFSGYNLYGNMCGVAKDQGQPVVLNVFYGVIANAGAGIALTISGTIRGLTTTVAQAFSPQIIKRYASSDYDNMALMMGRSIQFTLLAYSALAIPFVFETYRIIYLWLGQVPVYSCEFLRLVVVESVLVSMINSNNTAINSTGNIKRISFISGSIYLLAPIVSYFAIKNYQLPATTVYIVNIILLSIVVLLGWIFLKIQIPYLKIRLILKKLARVWGCIFLTLLLMFAYTSWDNYLVYNESETTIDSIIQILKTALLSFAILGVLSFFISLDRQERFLILRKLRLAKLGV